MDGVRAYLIFMPKQDLRRVLFDLRGSSLGMLVVNELFAVGSSFSEKATVCASPGDFLPLLLAMNAVRFIFK